MSFTRQELPRLDLLLSFEAAARRLSFTLAAQELFLTQSAVSRQIQQMEEDLGVALFERQTRALKLTPAGTTLYKATVDSLERLRDATGALRARAQEGKQQRLVSVTTTPGFASLWLIPRLVSFTVANPQVEVRLSPTLTVLDLDSKGIDIAIRLSIQSTEQGTPLFTEHVMPVCSPALLKNKSNPLKSPQDLAHHTLLMLQHEQSPQLPPMALMEDWGPWLNLMGLSDLHAGGTMRFTNFPDATMAAISGQGVLMGRFPLLNQHLKSGQLVAPFKGRAASLRGYYIMQSQRGQRNPDAQVFEAWLREEAAKTESTAS